MSQNPKSEKLQISGNAAIYSLYDFSNRGRAVFPFSDGTGNPDFVLSWGFIYY